jgi:elongation factor G
MDRYLRDDDLTPDDILAGLRAGTLSNTIIPVLCGSAFRNKGVQALLDAVVRFLPAPGDRPPVQGLDERGETAVRPADDAQPFAALAFKIMDDPHAGPLTFFRVYSGTLAAGDVVLNPGKGGRERIGRIVQMHANEREEITGVRAGDIAAAVGLKGVTTGDTLCAVDAPITLERIAFPEPVIAMAVEPKSEDGQQALTLALERLAAEDPSFRTYVEPESGQTIIAGMGELHLDILVDRMRREYGVEASVGRPQVAYRETLRRPTRQEGRFVRQAAGKGQFARVVLELCPQERGHGYAFDNALVGHVLPKECVLAVDQGVREALAFGPLAGFPVVDLRVRLVDATYHEVDSSELAFRIAASLAFKEGYGKAGAVLLEPVMRVAVVTPEEHVGDVMGDLSRRRGLLRGSDDSTAGRTIDALVPLGEMFGYATAMRSMSQGRATFTMEFDHYAEAPASIAEAIIKKN